MLSQFQKCDLIGASRDRASGGVEAERHIQGLTPRGQ